MDDVFTRNRLALAALCLAFFVVQLDATIVNIALEAIRDDLGGSLAGQQWVVDGYVIALAAGMLGAGCAGDRFGARRVCLLGLGVFGVASALCAVAPDVGALLLARVAQGVGAAALLPCSLALIVRQFPDPRRRAHALGVWGGFGSLGMAAGPVLGGALVVTLGWRLIFLVNLPCCLLAVLLIRAYADGTAARLAGRFDLVGLTLGALGMAAMVAAFIESDQLTRHPWWPAGLCAAAVVLLVLFVRHESRTVDPLLPLMMFRDLRYSAATGLGFLFNFGMYGALLCLTLYLQGTRHLSAWHAGLLVLPMTFAIGVGSTASGPITGRFGPRPPMVIGFAAGGVGALIIGLGAAAGSLDWVVFGATVLGCCSLAMPAMTSVAMSTAPSAEPSFELRGAAPARTGLASGVFNTARQTGGALGVAMLGGLLGLGGPTLLAPMLVTLVLFLVAAGLTLIATAPRRSHRSRGRLSSLSWPATLRRASTGSAAARRRPSRSPQPPDTSPDTVRR
jgi:DHA2 family methylenomycin A resistance protein-like MFS transporter